MRNRALSARGASIRGDDYQHLWGWIKALKVLTPGSIVTEIGIEDPRANGADDVTVYYADGRNELYQCKSAVDGRKMFNVDWLIEDDVLLRLFDVWKKHSDNLDGLQIELVTNRLPDTNDPFCDLLDGRSRKVTNLLHTDGPRSRIGKVRKRLTDGLRTTDAELRAFLSHVSFRIALSFEDLAERAREEMGYRGLRSDRTDLDQGIELIRKWVTSGKRNLSAQEVRDEIGTLQLEREAPYTTLLIQALDRELAPGDADIVFDWVDLFIGDDPRSRRLLHDNSDWNSRIRPEIKKAADVLNRESHRRVIVRGSARLPLWFTVGVEFSRTAGFDIASMQGGQIWGSTGGEINQMRLSTHHEQLRDGNSIAIGLSVSTDLSADVREYVENHLHEVGSVFFLSPERGPSNAAIPDPKAARDLAFSVRDLVRTITREKKPHTLHLFIATPRGFSLLLGHLWDRMPHTQLYEDLGSPGGYAPSFSISN